jgi:hypothetical protein
MSLTSLESYFIIDHWSGRTQFLKQWTHFLDFQACEFAA